MRDEILVPHLYLDSNVILDVLRDRRRHGQLVSLELLERAKRDKWFVSTSPFAIMEVLDIEQDDLFFQIKVSEGNTVADVLRIRRQRDLSKQLLDKISKRIEEKLRIAYSYIQYWELKVEGFDRAVELARGSNISAPDCIHLATALEVGCDILVTSDEFFMKEAKQYLPTSLPEGVEDELQNLGFAV